MTGSDRTRMWSLLREGYGIEDVAVLMGVDEKTIRRLVEYQRRQNRLHSQLGTDRARNAEALKIMGLSSRGDTQPCD